MPEERVSTKHFGAINAYLIESRSIGGLSGSPVYVHIATPRINEDGTMNSEASMMRDIWLLGLVHGHYDIGTDNEQDFVLDENLNTEKINMGIAIVIPAEEIMRTINAQHLADKRTKELDEYLMSIKPTEDSDGKDVATREDLEKDLRKAFRTDEDGTSGNEN